MKKLIFSLVIFLIMPVLVLASDVSYDIEDYYIDVTILENGDALVSEMFLVDGSLNGYEMNLAYTSSDIMDITVSGLSTNSISFDTFNSSFTPFSQVSYASIGDTYKYTLNRQSNGVSIRMYNPLNNERYVFRLDYTIKDIVTMHSDFAEFYWNFFSGELADEIGNLHIRVSLPGKDNTDYFRFWAHGPLSGEINDISSSTNSVVEAQIATLDANGVFDIRITFSASLVNNVTKYSNVTFADVLAEEQVRADDANSLRQEIRIKWWVAVIATIIFYISIVITFFLIYFKYDKEREPLFKQKYNREFIDDYNVEVIDYLMHRNITENALSASIMNLIYKKNIKAEAIPDKKDSYTFTLLNRDNLNETENSLVDFLFTTVGNDNTFTTMALKKYASNATTCRNFMASYTNWKNKVMSDGQAQNFFEKKKNYIWIPFVLLIYSIILLTFISRNNIEMFLGILTIFFAIIFVIYAIACTKKTKKGIEHFAKWKAFKNFLNDFGNFSIKELPEIVLWEKYLVYATVFGLADKVEKAMNVKITEFSDINNADYIMFTHIHNMHMASIISSSMHSAINSSQVSINRANASSSMSSGGGFGGGFSGGGGFGGGGRSGGGF